MKFERKEILEIPEFEELDIIESIYFDGKNGGFYEFMIDCDNCDFYNNYIAIISYRSARSPIEIFREQFSKENYNKAMNKIKELFEGVEE